MNACKVYMLSEDLEHQCVTEDSKTRVYLFVVRSEKQRLQRAKKVQCRRNKRMLRRALIIGAEVIKILLTLASMIMAYQLLSEHLLSLRGGAAIGSELLFVGLLGVAVWWLLDWIIGGGYE